MKITIVDYTLFHAMIRTSVPVIYAGLAGAISRQANVFNIAIEGIMCLGAFTAVSVSYFTGSWVLAVLCAAVIGLLASMLVGVFHIRYHANILVVGFAMITFAQGTTRFLLEQIYHTQGQFVSPKIIPIPNLVIHAFDDKPVLASLFSDYSLLEIFAFVLVAVLWFVFYKTRTGLHLRSVGLNDMAAQTSGINVNRTKYIAILLSGVIAGIGGAHLSLGYTTMYVDKMTAGRGFMGLAACNFGNANPLYTFLGCLLFGLCSALGSRLQAFQVPSQLILMIPYAVTVIVLTIAMIRTMRRELRQKSSVSRKRLNAKAK